MWKNAFYVLLTNKLETFSNCNVKANHFEMKLKVLY